MATRQGGYAVKYKVYKVALCKNDVFVSAIARGEMLVEYRLGEPSFPKTGTRLLAFTLLRDAREFRDRGHRTRPVILRGTSASRPKACPYVGGLGANVARLWVCALAWWQHGIGYSREAPAGTVSLADFTPEAIA